MKAFDKIIGYVSIKQELMQISDTLKNPQFYDKLGGLRPQGAAALRGARGWANP